MSQKQVHKRAAKVPQQRRSKGPGAAKVTSAAGPSQPASASGVGPVLTSATEEGAATRWVGWVFFAAVMMTIIGAFEIVAGLTAILNSGYYLVDEQGLLVSVDYTAWGWLHLGLGALAVAAGLGLLAARTWARVVSIALAMLIAVANLAFLAAHPLWSVIAISLAVVSIYAIAVHGNEVTASSVNTLEGVTGHE
jgi:hypothetical protein